MPGQTLEPTRDFLQFLGWKLRLQLFTRDSSFLLDRGPHGLQGVLRIPAIVVERVDEAHQHIDIAHGAELLRHFSESAVELPRRLRFESQYWKQFAKTARRDAGTVKGLDIPVVNSLGFTREDDHALSKRFV